MSGESLWGTLPAADEDESPKSEVTSRQSGTEKGLFGTDTSLTPLPGGLLAFQARVNVLKERLCLLRVVEIFGQRQGGL